MGVLIQRNFLIYLLAFALFFLARASFAAPIALKKIDISVIPTKPAVTQVILHLSQQTSYKTFTLEHPNRLVVDLSNTLYSQKNSVLNNSHSYISDVRHGIQNGTDLRIVFDLKQSLSYTNTTEDSNNGYRIIINIGNHLPPMANTPPQIKPTVSHVTSITPAPKTISQSVPTATAPLSTATPSITAPGPVVAPASIPTATPTTSPVTPAPSSPAVTVIQVKTANRSTPVEVPVITTPITTPITTSAQITSSAAPEQKIATATTAQNNDNDVDNQINDQLNSAIENAITSAPRIKRTEIVVIDPGHGGKDPGTTGPDGTEEKNVTIAIARDLETLVDKQPGMHAVLTREGDYYVGLRDRLAIARRDHGDIFIAIHADAYPKADAAGASVFALSLHGASSEQALWLAQKENYSEIGDINLNGIDDQDSLVRSVLIDLSQTATIGASLQLGNDVIKQLGKFTELHHGSVEQAPFMVLKSPDIPSILVETGFLSNPKEEARLRTDAYQEKIANALMAGVQQYFNHNPASAPLFATS